MLALSNRLVWPVTVLLVTAATLCLTAVFFWRDIALYWDADEKLTNMADCCIADRKFDKALVPLDILIGRHPKAHEYIGRKIGALQSLGRQEAVIATLDEEIRADPEAQVTWWAYVGRAKNRFAKLDYAGAANDDTQAIRVWPEASIGLLADRAEAYFRMGRLEASQNDCDEIIRRSGGLDQDLVQRVRLIKLKILGMTK